MNRIMADADQVLALAGDDEISAALVAVSNGIERISCCDLHKAALSFVAFTGLLRTLGWPEEKCFEVQSLLDGYLKDQVDASHASRH